MKTYSQMSLAELEDRRRVHLQLLNKYPDSLHSSFMVYMLNKRIDERKNG